MGSISNSYKPHAVCIPYPAQGHITPMLKLAKLLHHKGFHITFVNTKYNHNRLLKSRGNHSLDGLPDFRFEAIPDGLPPVDADVTQNIRALTESTHKNSLRPFRQLLAQLNDTSSDVPPVTCIVSDGGMIFTLDAAHELGVPLAFLCTSSACGLLGYSQYRNLLEKGIAPLKDESYLRNGYLETIIDWIPGMKNIRLKDLPSHIRTTDPNDFVVNYAIAMSERCMKGSALILNTFDDLEHDVIVDGLLPLAPGQLYPIGPLQLLLNQIAENPTLKSIDSNLWKEESQCLQWLNLMEPNSVVYVNFGSITVITQQQLTEFAWGLANSKCNFLWIIRPDLVAGDLVVLPPQFVTETKERGQLVGWCPQEQVLSHPSIGAFLTHCGWNSTLDSICVGVPMICWPLIAEQPTNCRYACTEWGIGMEIDNNVKRDEVEKLVRELMEGQRGKDMKNMAMEWKRRAEEATNPNGSSYMNFEKLVNEVLLSQPTTL